MRASLALAAVLLAAGCGGDSNGLRESLDDVAPGSETWALRSSCEGGRFDVVFRPDERIALDGIARASRDEIAIECGEPERVATSGEEGAPLPSDTSDPVYAAVRLACFADGLLFVSANPIWSAGGAIEGSSLMVVYRGQAVVGGVLRRGERDGDDRSRVFWSRAICRPA